MGREEEIRLIAYGLWVQDGCRHGSIVKYWLKAEAIWEHNQKAVNIPAPPPKETREIVMGGKR